MVEVHLWAHNWMSVYCGHYIGIGQMPIAGEERPHAGVLTWAAM